MGKPLIYLFRTPFGCYFYESGRNEIVSVKEELYRYIHGIVTDNAGEQDGAEQEIRQQYRELKECGYLSPPRVQRIQHPLTGELPELLSRMIGKVTLQVTQNCNLRCSYCVYSEDKNPGQRKHSENVMSFETAKEALDFYHDHSVDSETASIGFYGGEPLLAFPLIKKAVAYAVELFEGKDRIFAITTNATLLNEEIIDFLWDHRFKILVSMDGPEEIQNRNRRFPNGGGSYDLVMRNMKLLCEKFEDRMDDVVISMVIDPEEDYSGIIKLFEEPVLRGVGLTYSMVEEDGISKRPSDDFIAEHNYDLFLAYVKYFREEAHVKASIEYPSKIVEQDVGSLKDNVKRFKMSLASAVTAPGGPCVPGKMRFFVNCFGDFYPCERVNENCSMKIGSLTEGFDYGQIEKILNIGSLTEQQCKQCWAFPLCSICAKRVDDNGNLSAAKKLKACGSAKNIALSKITDEILVYENDRHMRRMAELL